ncbi:TreTu family toxin [Rugamonas violacea]
MAISTTIELIRVGRWMSRVELTAMLVSRRVQESYSGTTHVSLPPSPRAFMRQARPGSLYVEFDVLSTCLKSTGAGWAKIIGPNSLEGRIAMHKGLPILHMPKASNIEHLASLWI